jgi:predicted aspartyl protease
MVQTKCGFDTTTTTNGPQLLTQYGPTLFVDIGFDPTFRPDAPTIPAPGLKGIEALVDTGASISCIDNILAASLNLPVIDRRPISGVHGCADANVYLAQVRVPGLEFTIYGEFIGVDLQAGGQWHKALIGRTFLRHFTMTYEGRTGTVIISND